LGSVPALVGLVASARLLTTPVRRFVPLAASLLLIVAGAYTATGRGMAEWNGPWRVSNSLVDKLQSSHSVDGLNANDIQSGMEQLVSTPLPCCQGKAKENSSSAKEDEASR